MAVPTLIRRRLLIAAALFLSALSMTAGFLCALIGHPKEVRVEGWAGQEKNLGLAPTRVDLILGDDSSATLTSRQETLVVPKEDSERILAELGRLLELYHDSSSPHRIAPGARLRAVYRLSSDTFVLDLSREFLDRRVSGIVSEALTIGSLLGTIHANHPRIRHVKLLVEGQERATLAGHLELAPFYDPSQSIPGTP